MRDRPKIALLIETTSPYGRRLLEGIYKYSRTHGPWTVLLAEPACEDMPPKWLKDWDGDGILARVENQKICDAVVATGIPTVDLSVWRLAPQFPMVETDDMAFAELALDHLTEKGLTQFAYCSDHRFKWSRNRQVTFQSLLQSRGFECHLYESFLAENNITAQGEDVQHELIEKWVAQLPKPIGIYCCYDHRGRQVIDACRAVDIAVPESVAVVSVDNDELLCELCDPSLTSIYPDTKQTGYKAAELLDQMMKRGKSSWSELNGEYLIPPIGIVARQSSDMLAIEDRRIAEAVSQIRRSACDGITVSELVEKSGWSRRVFESRFKAILGVTPHDMILKRKLDRCCELLTDSRLPLHEIAPRAGFKHSEYLSTTFKKHYGVSPIQYRTRLAKEVDG